MKLDPRLKDYFTELDGCDAGFGDNGPINVHSRSRVNDTPLHWAAIRGLIDVGHLLIKTGADVNAIGESGYTPIHEAIAHKYPDFLKLLLMNGGDLSIDSDDISTALLLESDPESKAVVEEFLKG